ncbi:MAG: sigma-54-dependent Fis family transcriptional regulator [Planctomyces sp.]|nr:sigma-54-dependent Fis family transcriptional regulator [Planctomyces sp.]
MPSLLIIDDEPSIHHAFQRAFRTGDLDVRSAHTAAEGLRLFHEETPDVVVLDLHLPDFGGFEVFRRMHERDARIPVIFITGHGTTDLAIEAIKQGAFDYLLKPLELPALRELLDRAIRSSLMMRTPAAMPEVEEYSGKGDPLIGRCPAMQELYKGIGRVAGQSVTVLILGESGTGKELVARAIYQHSTRANSPFLAINCAAIPEQLLESELFGHEKGAFSGADRKRIGKFEQCDGGTIFLDEVGEMSPIIQAKILRLIQEQQFERVGGTETIQTNVRLIAATNADLEALVEAGRFRRDLYFRLNVCSLLLPPLRERGNDIQILVQYFVKRFSNELRKPVLSIAPAAMEMLVAWHWPGNVRELQSVLKQAILNMQAAVLLPEFLPNAIRDFRPEQSASSNGPSGPAPLLCEEIQTRISSGTENLHAEIIEIVERELLMKVLTHTEGNQVQAARILGISRGSLRSKIRSLGINFGRSVWSEDDQPDS